MKALPFLLLITLLSLAACQSAEAPPPEPETSVAADTAGMPVEYAPVEARMEDGMQVVDVTVGPAGYEPSSIRLREGVPARLVFTRTVEGECAERVRIPAYEIGPVEVPLEETVAVEFTPDETGTFQFVCGMDMMSGRLIVVS